MQDDENKPCALCADATCNCPKIEAYFFPKNGPPCLVPLPFTSLTPLPPRKRPAKKAGNYAQRRDFSKPTPGQMWLGKLKGFFLRRLFHVYPKNRNADVTGNRCA